MGELNMDVLGIINPPCLKSLIMALLSAIFPENQSYIWFTIFLGIGGSSGYRLGGGDNTKIDSALLLKQ